MERSFASLFKGLHKELEKLCFVPSLDGGIYELRPAVDGIFRAKGRFHPNLGRRSPSHHAVSYWLGFALPQAGMRRAVGPEDQMQAFLQAGQGEPCLPE